MRPVIIPGPRGPHIANETHFIKWSTFIEYILKDQPIPEKYHFLIKHWLSKNIHLKCYPLSNKRCPDCIYLIYTKKIINSHKNGSPRSKRYYRRTFHKLCNAI